MSRSLFQSTAVTGGAEGDVVTIIVGTPTGAGPESADWSYQTADIETVAGAAIGGGQVKLKAGGVTPRFYGPDGVTTLKVLRNRAVAATLTGIADPLAAGTSVAQVPIAKTAAYTAASGDAVLADASGGAFAVTLPAPANGAKVTVKNVGATGTVTVEPDAAETIDGSTSFALLSQNESRDFLSDGTDWWVV